MLVFLIDADKLSSSAWIEEACNSLEAAEGSMAVRRAYGSAENLKGLAQTMLACQTPKPNVMAIGSGDADFVPLVVRLRERGIRMICVSERSKMASEAAHAYDSVLFVGNEPPKAQAKKSAIAPATKTPTKKVAAKKAVAVAAPAKKVATKKKASTATDVTTKSDITLEQILAAAPALRMGQMQPLGDIVKQLHSAKLIGKNATSTKLFKKFPERFELTPMKQPNQVRYLPA